MGIWDKFFNSPTYQKPTTSGTGAYPMVAPTPYVGQPAVQHPVGFPQLPLSELQRQSGQIVLSGNEKSYYPQYGSNGSVQGAATQAPAPPGDNPPPPIPGPDLNDLSRFMGGGGGGGGGISAAQAAYDNMRREMQRLAEAERGNIESRRDTLLGETEAGYGDQVKYLDTQEQNIRGQADSGRNKITGQKEETTRLAQQDAELASKMARDTYRDLIVQGRRRSRATGAGSSSGYLEITGMLDKQLMTGLGQVEQTKQNKVMTANKIAEQAVADIELSLNQVMGELNNNRALSLRERDKAANEIRMNAADALLEVDKWVTGQFADIEQAKANLRTGGGGGGNKASYNKAAYSQAQGQNVSNILRTAALQKAQLEETGKYNTNVGQAMFADVYGTLMGQGLSHSAANSLAGGMFIPRSANSDYDRWDEDPERFGEYLGFKSNYE